MRKKPRLCVRCNKLAVKGSWVCEDHKCTKCGEPRIRDYLSCEKHHAEFKKTWAGKNGWWCFPVCVFVMISLVVLVLLLV